MIRNIFLIAAIGLTTSLWASNQKAMDAKITSGSKIQGQVQSFVVQDALPQAQVVVYGETSDIIRVTITNSNGEFEFNDLPEGKYYITINYLGYKPVVVDNIEVTSNGEPVSLKNLSLEKAFYQIKEVVCKAERKNNTNNIIFYSITE